MAVDAKRVQSIFLTAVESADAAQRAALLDQECGADAELRLRVEALLQAHQAPDSILERPPAFEAVAPTPDGTVALDSSSDQQAASMATPERGSVTTDGGPKILDEARTDPSVTQADHSADVKHDLPFLAPSAKPGHLGQLGHYEILGVIGKGGFGIVLKGFDERLHRVVAIKVLSSAFAANGSARKRFIREARAAAAVKNEHVVGIYDVQEDAEPPYLVMECIDGISLQDKIDKHGSLGVKEILRIGMQIAAGLADAHKQGLVHRDIKPANILLENGVERVKITDFGLARAVDDASVTQSGTVAGTPMYMSPEQAEGLPIDHRSDLFSLGTVLYAMCTGHPPFRASGTHAVLKRVIDASPRPICEINPEMPDWLCDIIAKLHAKKPQERFHSAKEVAALLGRHLADVQAGRAAQREPGRANDKFAAPVTGGAASLVQATGSRKGRRWAIVAALLVAALMPFAYFFGNTCLLFVRNEGELCIQTDDPDIVVTVIQGAAVIHDRSDLRDFVLGAGVNRVKVAVRGKDDFLTKDVMIPRGTRVTLDLDREQAALEARAREKTGNQLGAIGKAANDLANESGWVQLFNGVDLTGWDGDIANWRTSEESLSCSLDGSIKQSEIFTKSTFENYELRLQYHGLIPQARHGSGALLLHCDGRPRGTCLQLILDGEDGTEDPSIKAVGGAKAFHLPATDPGTTRKEGWNDLYVVSRNGTLTVSLNGKLRLSVPFSFPRKGAIGLMAMHAFNRFRKIEIKELSPADDASTDRARLQGKWRVVSGEYRGRPMAVAELREFDWIIFDGDGQSWNHKDKVFKGTYRLNASSDPKQLDFLFEGSKPNPMIYKFDGETLVIAEGGPDRPRPASFQTTPTTQFSVQRFRRETAPGFVPLFNGKDTDGWKPLAKAPNNWKVENGILVGRSPTSYLMHDGFGKKPFHVRAETRINDGGDGAVIVHTSPETTGSLGASPFGCWVAINSTNKLSSYRTGSLRCRYLGYINEPGLLKPPPKANEWLILDVISRDGHITVKVNGEITAVTDIGIRGGGSEHIALVVDGENSVVEFKTIEIKGLPAAPVKGKDQTGRRVIRFDPARDIPIRADGITPEDGGWKIVAAVAGGSDRAYRRLFELRDLDVENCKVTLRGQLKTATPKFPDMVAQLQLQAHGYVLTQMKPKPAHFGNKLSEPPARGSTAWAPYEVTATFLGRPPAINVNLYSDGGNGTVWLKDLELAIEPLGEKDRVPANQLDPPVLGPAKSVRRFAPPKDGFISLDNVTTTDKGWKIEFPLYNKRTLRMFELRDHGLDEGTLILRVRLKSDVGASYYMTAYPLVELRPAGSAEAKKQSVVLASPTKALHNTNWTTYEVRVPCQKAPHIIALALSMDGLGSVWIEDIELLHVANGAP